MISIISMQTISMQQLRRVVVDVEFQSARLIIYRYEFKLRTKIILIEDRSKFE